MMLAGAKAIAARAQPPGKGDNIASLKNCQIQFVWDGYLLYAFRSFGHLRLRMQASNTILFLLKMFIKENISWYQSLKYHPKHVNKRKKFLGPKGVGGGGSGTPRAHPWIRPSERGVKWAHRRPQVYWFNYYPELST